MEFKAWYVEVDKAFIELTSLDRDSWPDQDYYLMWESDYSPKEAVIAAIENEYGEAGLEAFGLAVE